MEFSFYLPPELWDYIFKFFPIKKLIKLNLVSKFFNKIIELNKTFRCKTILFKNRKENSETIKQFRWGCKNGHLEVCKWLESTFNLTTEDIRSKNNYALQLSCWNGHLEVCKWLVSTFNLTTKDARSKNNYALLWACYFGHLEVCKWLEETFGITI